MWFSKKKKIDRAIRVLRHLAKVGPSSSKEIAKLLGIWRLRAGFVLSELGQYGYIVRARPFPGAAPELCENWKLTNTGRRFLEAHEALDTNAPFGTFE
jgi:DNA-binding MarR family transcriptional regulator